MTIKCCMNCKERSVGCHSVCEKYIAERKELDEYRAGKMKLQETRNMLWETYKQGVKNMKGIRAKWNEQRRKK